MRKFVFLLSLSLFVSMSAQEIQTDKEEDGIRSITSKSITNDDTSDSGSWEYILSVSRNDKETTYVIALIITGIPTSALPDEPGILIRFFGSDDVMKLNGFDVRIFPHEHFASFIAAKITESQLKRFSSGMSKIRVETIDNYIERVYPRDECGYRIYKTYENLKNQLSKPRKSFADGF